MFGLMIGAALALGILGGCDDQDNGDQNAGGGRHKSGSVASRLGLGWHAPSEGRISAWKFSGAAPVAVSPASGPDPADSISVALMAKMLPSRDSVRISDFVGRVTRWAQPPDPRDAALSPKVVLSTTPWNDDTLLMWVEIPGRIADSGAPISIEFDPRTVAGFRPLGDPSALPMPEADTGRAGMLYELAIRPDDHPRPDRPFATLHIGAGPADAPVPQRPVDRLITAADFADSIDDAPDIVRLAAAAAGFAQLLQGDPAVRDLSCHDVINLAESADGPDPDGQRARMIDLMHRAEPLIDLPPTDAPAPPPEEPVK